MKQLFSVIMISIDVNDSERKEGETAYLAAIPQCYAFIYEKVDWCSGRSVDCIADIIGVLNDGKYNRPG